MSAQTGAAYSIIGRTNVKYAVLLVSDGQLFRFRLIKFCTVCICDDHDILALSIATLKYVCMGLLYIEKRLISLPLNQRSFYF